MEKIFGVVILFHPAEDVSTNIASYLSSVEKLFVIDNSEPAIRNDFSECGEKVIVIADDNNSGIAARLNQAATIAIQQGAKWLLTMDQDSFFSANFLMQYLECLRAVPNKDIVAMFGVEFESIPERIDCSILETDKLITSGSIVNLDVFQKVGGFDENLFIDEVDFEYCLRSINKGFKTIQFENIYLSHSLGTISQHRSLKSLKKTSRTLHAPLRLYYMYRNYLYLRKIYGLIFPQSLKFKRKSLLNRIKNNLLYGQDRLQTLKYLITAYKHYKSGKMGKLSD